MKNTIFQRRCRPQRSLKTETRILFKIDAARRPLSKLKIVNDHKSTYELAGAKTDVPPREIEKRNSNLRQKSERRNKFAMAKPPTSCLEMKKRTPDNRTFF